MYDFGMYDTKNTPVIYQELICFSARKQVEFNKSWTDTTCMYM